MIPLIKTQYDTPKTVFEENSGESNVDKALFRTTKQRIDDYIRSGETLEDLRRLQYHSDYLEDMVNNPNWTDPLLYRGMDRSDIELYHQQAVRDIIERRRLPGVSTDAVSGVDKKPEQGKSVVTPEANGSEQKNVADSEAEK